MKIADKYIKNIISANSDNRLAIFIGAGVSKSSETKSIKLPSWNDLIRDMKEELDVVGESDYLKVAQLYHLAFGEFTYYKKLKDYFPDYISPSEIHKMIFELNPHVIITTNWDCILEKTIEENAYIYDVICSDRDLVKSNLQNKLIKMHGDFKNHNIVFKEDDYINYSYNFPLIENYIKSILSTHTVVFFGYSYNDINLKHLIKWIQNHSDVRPPMYLTAFTHNQNQIDYLKNHGITTIVIEDIDSDLIYINNFEYYSQILYTFLDKVKTKNEKQILGDSEEIISFVYEKIKSFNILNSILIEQIEDALSNCTFIFDSDLKPILQFHDQILTSDFNKNIRIVYGEFIDILRVVDAGKEPNYKLLKIFEILSKADIKGIVISNENERNRIEYIPLETYTSNESINNLSQIINFDYSELSDFENNNQQELAFKVYNLNEYESAFILMEESIAHCLKQRNYTWLFIAMSNRNILLQHLKYGFNSPQNREKYLQIEKYNLKEKYHNLPRDIKQALQPIYEFIDFSSLYKYAYDISDELRKIESSKETIQAGGIVLSSNTGRFQGKHENLVKFVILNKIMIEHYVEFRGINKTFIKIAVARQVQNNIVTLTKIELFTCIKYLDYKDLRSIFEEFYLKDSTRKGKFELDKELKKWFLETALTNIIREYTNPKRKTSSWFVAYLKNFIFISSLMIYDEDELNFIVSALTGIVKEGNNSIDMYQCINSFFGIQYSLNELQISEDLLIGIIETIITKFISEKHSFQEFSAITTNKIPNLYEYAQNKKIIFKNNDLVDRLIKTIDLYEVSEKVDAVQNFILNLYEITTDKIKKKIRLFVTNLDLTNVELEKKLPYILMLSALNFRNISDEDIKLLDIYLDQYKSGRSFSTLLYRFDALIDYLIGNGIADLSQQSEIVKSAIERYKSTTDRSIF